MHELEQVKNTAQRMIADAETLQDLEVAKVELFGKKGALTSLLQSLKDLTPEERKTRGQDLNLLKESLFTLFDTKKAAIEEALLDMQLKTEMLDLTLPERPTSQGLLHPINHVFEEIISIFGEMGFAVVDGPHIEEDYYNFEALNIPEEHPARQEQDTFYLPTRDDGKKMVLRTQTSPVQMRTMESSEPPIAIISIGRVFRSDYDITHSPMFHQVEGLVIAENIHMGHLKGCLTHFFDAFFGVDNIPLRFRPSYFPFTEPSAEVDVGYTRQADGSFAIGHGKDWLEILGCGMVHPIVLQNGGIDPERYQGFAFGMGVERITMLKYGISDLRTFFEPNMGWQKHYGFKTTDIPSLLTSIKKGGVK